MSLQIPRSTPQSRNFETIWKMKYLLLGLDIWGKITCVLAAASSWIYFLDGYDSDFLRGDPVFYPATQNFVCDGWMYSLKLCFANLVPFVWAEKRKPGLGGGGHISKVTWGRQRAIGWNNNIFVFIGIVVIGNIISIINVVIKSGDPLKCLGLPPWFLFFLALRMCEEQDLL